MNKMNLFYFLIVCIFMLLILFNWNKQEVSAKEKKHDLQEGIEITITYDNYPFKPGLKASWGFSCVIQKEDKTILFDTGGNGSTLLGNMKKLEITPREIDLIVLSHIHGDHVGGVEYFLRQNAEVDVYLPQSFPRNFKEKVRHYGANVFEVQESTKICPGVYSTGELGKGIKEQALILQTGQGIIIITGCAHPGIINIIKKSKELLKEDIFLVMGGFHLMGQSQISIEKIISGFRNLGVRFVGACHCSGDLARRLFKLAYGKYYIEIGLGKIIHLNELME